MTPKLAAAGACVIGALVLLATYVLSADPTRIPEPDAAAVAERARLVAHLKGVVAELRARDVSHLSASQRAARERHLDVLREYIAGGRFPHNHDRPGEWPPIFVDEHGTLCAMAYLIARSGRTDLVARVAASRNNAYIHELADDPELVAWLDAAGLTVDEAARIQPWYDYLEPEPEPEPATRYTAASAVLLGVNGALGIYNLAGTQRPGETARWPGMLGVAAGAAGLGLGAAKLGNDDGPGTLALLNATVGVIGATLGGIRLNRSRQQARASSPDPTLDLLPVAKPEGAGLQLQLRF